MLPAEVSSSWSGWCARRSTRRSRGRWRRATAVPRPHRPLPRPRPPGTVGVYSEGVTAGRLLYVGEGGAELSDAHAGDIVVTEHVPDWLPQASAIITSDPQTPLAHVNLLARNRGIPNASQAGIHDDAGVRQAARVRAYAIVITGGTTLQIALDHAASSTRRGRRGSSRRRSSVPPVDIANMPLVVDLDDLVAQLSPDGVTEAEVADWRPIIGGKSAGFLTLLSTPPGPDPAAGPAGDHRPAVHRASRADARQIAAAIGDPTSRFGTRRWLVLEGDDDYADLFPSDADAEFATDVRRGHPAGIPARRRARRRRGARPDRVDDRSIRRRWPRSWPC